MGVVRLALALIVLADHAGFSHYSISARASVQVFFVLSGIYMAAVYTTKYKKMPDGARFFLINRALRLWPTYLFLLGLTGLVWLLVGSRIGNDDYVFNLFTETGWSSLVMGLLSIILFGQDVASVSEPLHFLLPVRQSWSIASELLFYLTVPLILRTPRPDLYFAGFLALMGVKYLALVFTSDDRLSYFFPLGNYGYFLLGCFLYFMSTHPGIEHIKKYFSPYRGYLILALLSVLFLNGASSFEINGFWAPFRLLLAFSAFSILIFERSANPVGNFLGNLSYGVYLNHFLILSILQGVGVAGLPLLLSTIVGSIVLGFLVEHYLQKPVDRYRYRRIHG